MGELRPQLWKVQSLLGTQEAPRRECWHTGTMDSQTSKEWPAPGVHHKMGVKAFPLVGEQTGPRRQEETWTEQKEGGIVFAPIPTPIWTLVHTYTRAHSALGPGRLPGT